MDRRRFLIGTTASTSALWAGRIGAEDTYPSRSITVINPFPPGGVSDTITRPLDAALEAVLKQPVMLENKPGAAG
ncbi:MAG TPA: tripartite tricarboxylate transporter substrate binding protein, partial [Hyphomicrobiaceae bacterium]|nr:tripartite tricarboxylate transporter substrate binding protein [Hyphomicrobiaceae bacterium]